MKILIVDDNKDNRMTIELLLEEFDDLDIQEVEDGQEAIDICKNENFDIIFMDIMMPNVDGIKATTFIKSFDKKVMILALSALDDETSKNKMLEAGAEDYITKPIEDELFHQRVKNYLQIVEARKQKLSNENAVNHFTQEIYSRSLKFQVTKLQSLAEFWDYYLNDTSHNIEGLEECIRMVYAYGQLCLKNDLHFVIYAEENDDNLYITLSSINILSELVIKHTLLNHYKDAIFILKDTELSFRLPKKITILEKKIIESEFKNDSNEEKIDLTDYEQKILSKTHFSKTTAVDYVNNTAITLIDKIELLQDTQETLEVSAVGFEKKSTKENLSSITDDFVNYIDVIDELLEFEHFAYALSTLNNFLISLDFENTLEADFKKFSILFLHLLDDIAEWRNNIFILQEANDVHYLDSSLLSSCLQIQSIFEKKDVAQDDEDDFELF